MILKQICFFGYFAFASVMAQVYNLQVIKRLLIICPSFLLKYPVILKVNNIE